MTNLYTIGEVSRFLKISTKALRHYDEMELLKPYYIAPDTNYRYYSYDQFFTIDVIRYLNKTLSIPLDNVKKLLEENKESDYLLELLESHKKFLNEKIAAMEYSKQLTDNLIRDTKYRKKYPEKIGIYEQFLMSRNLYYKEMNTSIYDIDKYVTRNFENMEPDKNNIMCLLFSLSEYKRTQQLMVKGFGVFSDNKLPGLKCKTLRDSRYLTKSFLYSEEKTMSTLNELDKYAGIRSIELEDTAILISKMVNLEVYSKYDYCMELQIICRL